MPDTIGHTEDPGGPERLTVHEAPVSDDERMIVDLMAQVSFEEQDVRDLLGEAFDFMAEWRKSDHWRLTDRQARILGRPTAQLLNAIWAKLIEKIPGIIGNWCQTTPGASAFIAACGIVVVPKAITDWKLTRQRKSTAPARAGAAPPAPAAPAQPKTAGSMIWHEGKGAAA